MRFRRRLKIFPGVVLNFSKQGVSTTIGVPGANVNFNRDGQFLNTGIPGTGLYDRHRIGDRRVKRRITPSENRSEAQKLGEEIATTDIAGSTSEGMRGLRDTLIACHDERKAIKGELKKAKRNLERKKNLLIASRIVLIGFVFPWFKNKRNEVLEDIGDLEKQLEDCRVNVEMHSEPNVEAAFENLRNSFGALKSSNSIWDITSSASKTRQKKKASELISRERVELNFKPIPVINSSSRALHFENANGGDLYFFPPFLAIIDRDNTFGLVDIREINCAFKTQKTAEVKAVPTDAKIEAHTWLHANKDGSRDKRYKNNVEIPVCLYGRIDWTSPTGVQESYLFSNVDLARAFAESFSAYQNQVLQEIET